jgi:large subunit ribosomal protein L25
MDATLAAVTRVGRRKNEARRLRRAGQVPAILYGQQQTDSVAVSVDPKTLLQILYSESGVNTLISLSVDEGDPSRVLVKDFQLDPVTSQLLHVDFYQPPLDRAITVGVPVTLVGEPVGVKEQGGLVDFIQREVQLECMPTEIPEHIEVDISELMIGQGIRLRELLEGVSWSAVSDPESLLVHVVPPKVEEEEEATDEAAVGEGGEPEEAGGAKPEDGDGSPDK